MNKRTASTRVDSTGVSAGGSYARGRIPRVTGPNKTWMAVGKCEGGTVWGHQKTMEGTKRYENIQITRGVNGNIKGPQVHIDYT